ncbi:MAG: hypothetical protein ACRYGF_14530 [Janthinobacterium lividum]
MDTNKQDGNIDTVLRALRQAEPDPGMQDRLLASLRVAQVARTTAKADRWTFPLAVSGVGLPWLAAATLLLAAGGTLLLHRHAARGSHTDQIAASGAAKQKLAMDPKWESNPRLENDISVGGRSTDPLVSDAAGRLPHVSGRHGTPLQTTTESHVFETRRGALHGNRDAASGTDALATASFPAPPLPLTEQERLLLALVRREAPQRLLPLTESSRSATTQREKSAVTEFFAPPPPLPGQQEPLSEPEETGQP